MMNRIELNGWNVNINFSASHLLPRHEKCGRIHGHNYAIHAKIAGEERDEGVIFDFLPLKKELRKIAEEMDHRILLAENMEGLSVKKGEIRVEYDDKRYLFPKVDTKMLPIGKLTAEQLAGYVLSVVLERVDFPDNIQWVEIGVDESRGQGAWVRREL